MADDYRRYAPATQRNRQPILAVLTRVLPPKGTVLEVSSGTGEHAIFFAPRLKPRFWLPTDVSPVALQSIAAWQQAEPADNLCPPLQLDARQLSWPFEAETGPPSVDLGQHPITAIVSINMVHIAPWDACQGLMAGAGRLLPTHGVLYLYGPFKRSGEHTASSNEAFDRSLRSQDPEWGVRDLETVVAEAEPHRLYLQEIVDMPANNLSVVFRKVAAARE